MGRSAILLAWVGTRLLTLVLLFAYEGSHGVIGDVNYFGDSLASLHDVGLAHTLVEYPLPAVGLVGLPWLLAVALGSTGLYPLLVIIGALAVDGAFTVMLASRREPGRNDGVLFWLVAAPLLGGLTLARFDLVAGVLVAAALLVVAQRPRVASVAIALATALKLWPVLLLPSLVAAVRRRRDALVPFLVVGVVVAGACLLLAGWDRLVSPLVYQSDRGLQIESLSASPAMVGWLVDSRRWDVRYSHFKAFEVSGPAVPALIALSTVLSVLLLAGLVLLWWRALRRATPVTPEGLLWLCLASVCAYLFTSKVFSPQYLLWLLPIAAAGLTIAPGRVVRRWSVGLLAAAALSHLIYPVFYRGLVEHGWQSPVAVALLVVRNLLVVGLLVVAGRQAWRATSNSLPVPERTTT